MQRVQGRHGLLKDHRDFATADRLHLGTSGFAAHQVQGRRQATVVCRALPVIEDFAGDNAPRRLDQPQNREAGDRFAADPNFSADIGQLGEGTDPLSQQ